MNINTTLKTAGVISLALAISACSGGSSSKNDDSTTYTVGVSVPDALVPQTAFLREQPLNEKLKNFFLSSAYAVDGSNLRAENFAVTIVDPDGNVVEIVEVDADDISQNPDGTWEISVPGDPRLDCIIVADLDSPATVSVGSPIPTDVVYAPTTAPTIDIDIQSTAAYQEFLANLPAEISSFSQLDSVSVDEVELIINAAQEVELPSIQQGQTLADYVQVAIAAVESVVEAELTVAIASTTGQVADALTAGLYWFEAYVSGNNYDFIEYGTFTATTPEAFFEFNGSTFTQVGAGTEYILTSSGLTPYNDVFSATANADGSITFSPAAAPQIQYRADTVQVVDVTGLPISNFFTDPEDFGAVIPSNATFAAGGLAYRTGWTVVNELYELDDDVNCTPEVDAGCYGVYAGTPGNTSLATSLASLVSASAGSQGIEIGGSNNYALSIELVTGGTAIFYTWDFVNAPVQIATSTWEAVTVGGVQLYRYTLPASVKDNYEVWWDDSSPFFYVNAGYVRMGQYYPAGYTEDGTDWFFDGTSGPQVINAVDTTGLTPFN